MNELRFELKSLNDYLDKERNIEGRLCNILCDVLDSIGRTLEIRNYTIDAVYCFKVLYSLATRVKNDIDIINSFIFFANNGLHLQSINKTCSNVKKHHRFYYI